MMSLFRKIKLSYTLYILFFVSLISGLFKDISVFFLIIFIHEIGHIIASMHYKWNIKKVDFTLAGGFITYEDEVDKPFKEELIISVSGFVMQWIFFFLIFILFKNNVINYKLYFMIKKYHLSIFFFNLMPIIPLDGSKILHTIICSLTYYKKALKISFIVSVISFIVLFYLYLSYCKGNFGMIIVFFFIIKKIITYLNNIPYLYNKVLLERYIKKRVYKKNNFIKKGMLEHFKRQKNNLFYNGKRYVSEYSILKERFD